MFSQANLLKSPTENYGQNMNDVQKYSHWLTVSQLQCYSWRFHINTRLWFYLLNSSKILSQILWDAVWVLWNFKWTHSSRTAQCFNSVDTSVNTSTVKELVQIKNVLRTFSSYFHGVIRHWHLPSQVRMWWMVCLCASVYKSVCVSGRVFDGTHVFLTLEDVW